jgi:aldehyde dehydrogenase (NAD+)
MTPLGVAGLITPWNSDAGFICGKLAAALAAGCTAVIKPSEMSALQTQIVTEALRDAALPPGVFNIVTGRGETVGETISRHPDVAKISFTGSTNTGKAILRNAAESFKRVTLELGGKSPTILLDDVDLVQAIPLVIQAGFMNSGQACVAGTRILVPLAQGGDRNRAGAGRGGGEIRRPAQQRDRRRPDGQRKAVAAGAGLYPQRNRRRARLLAGGEGRPDGTRDGWFVRPTLFADVNNRMTIARDEIFGPVLCVIPYQDEAEAIAIANDTEYGLSAMVLGGDVDRARRVAQQIVSGRVLVNTLAMNRKRHLVVQTLRRGARDGRVGNSGVYGAEVDGGLKPARWRCAYRAYMSRRPDKRSAIRHNASLFAEALRFPPAFSPQHHNGEKTMIAVLFEAKAEPAHQARYLQLAAELAFAGGHRRLY